MTATTWSFQDIATPVSRAVIAVTITGTRSKVRDERNRGTKIRAALSRSETASSVVTRHSRVRPGQSAAERRASPPSQRERLASPVASEPDGEPRGAPDRRRRCRDADGARRSTVRDWSVQNCLAGEPADIAQQAGTDAPDGDTRRRDDGRQRERQRSDEQRHAMNRPGSSNDRDREEGDRRRRAG